MLLIVLSMNFTAPSAPSQAELYLPEDTENFADGLLHILKTALSQISPDLTNAAQICLSLVAIVLLISLLRSFSGVTKTTTQLVGTLLVSILLVKSSQTLISLGVETIQTMSEYGKLLLPVMAAALAAQGESEISCVHYIERGYEDIVSKLRAVGANIRAVEEAEPGSLEAHIS